MVRNMFVAGCLLASALGAGAQELVPLPAQPDGLAWPTDGWEQGEMPPETAALVQPLIDTAMANSMSDVMGVTRGVVIIHHGKLVAEAYREPFTPETKQISWSMAKSVTSALVGRAVRLGFIETIDAPMPSPFGESDPRAQITWRQWLNMTDGLDYHEIDEADLMKNDVVQMMYGRGRFNVIRYIKDELPAALAPGTVWNYSTAAYHLIGRALQGVNGVNSYCSTSSSKAAENERFRVTSCAPADAPMESWITGTLFQPLGMDALVEFDTSGTYLGGSLVWASARDFAKFGYLYLRDGVWDGTRLLPEGWVDFARTKTPAENSNVYGAGFWITAYGAEPTHGSAAVTPPWDAFHAGGHEGQTIWIVPSRDLVIVRLGIMDNSGGNWPALYEWNQEIARAFPEAASGQSEE